MKWKLLCAVVLVVFAGACDRATALMETFGLAEAPHRAPLVVVVLVGPDQLTAFEHAKEQVSVLFAELRDAPGSVVTVAELADREDVTLQLATCRVPGQQAFSVAARDEAQNKALADCLRQVDQHWEARDPSTVECVPLAGAIAVAAAAKPNWIIAVHDGRIRTCPIPDRCGRPVAPEIDYTCATSPSTDTLRSFLRRHNVLQPSELAGIHVAFAFNTIAARGHVRCDYTQGVAKVIAQQWSQVIAEAQGTFSTSAGPAHVQASATAKEGAQ
jgi:hypothetical protein